MGWEVVSGDELAGTIVARMGDGAEVTIKVARRPDGLTETTLTPRTPQVDRQVPRYSEYLRRAYATLR
jgi:hypothetical protein